MNRHLINHKATVLDALGRLNALSGENMTLVVTDDDGVMVGTLTDGDLRRSLVSSQSLSLSVADVMHRDFLSISEGNPDVALFKTARKRGISLIPELRADGTVSRLLDLRKIRALLPLSALVMAGGRGERLRPLTDTTPKPLLKIGDRPIIDYNISALLSVGIDDIVVSVRYLADQLIAHFEEYPGNIRCLVEDRPLGTIGAISLIDDFRHDNILVMNSDLLTTLAIDDMYIKHIDSSADITVAAIPYTVSVPYAILATEGDKVTAIEEKPTYSYYANAGIYIISRRAAHLVQRGTHVDATDLIELAIEQGMKVAYFPVNGTWIDVGSHADFRHAAEIMKYHRTTIDK